MSLDLELSLPQVLKLCGTDGCWVSHLILTGFSVIESEAHIRSCGRQLVDCVCMCVWLPIPVCVCVEVIGYLAMLSSLLPFESGDPTQDTRCGRKHLYLLRHEDFIANLEDLEGCVIGL